MGIGRHHQVRRGTVGGLHAAIAFRQEALTLRVIGGLADGAHQGGIQPGAHDDARHWDDLRELS